MNENQTDALGLEIQRLLGDRTQVWLSEQSGVSQSTISRITTGFHKDPARLAKALDAIARALSVDSAHLLRIAGLSLPAAELGSNPEVEYLIQKLYALPPDLQREAVDTLGSMLDTIYKVAGLNARTPSQQRQDAMRDTDDVAEEYRLNERNRNQPKEQNGTR